MSLSHFTGSPWSPLTLPDLSQPGTSLLPWQDGSHPGTPSPQGMGVEIRGKGPPHSLAGGTGVADAWAVSVTSWASVTAQGSGVSHPHKPQPLGRFPSPSLKGRGALCEWEQGYSSAPGRWWCPQNWICCLV